MKATVIFKAPGFALLNCLILASMLVGCGNQGAKKDDRMFVLTVGGMSLNKLEVNGEPAAGGGMITYFVVNGKNDILFEGEDEDWVRIMFGRCETIMGKNWEYIWDVDENPNKNGATAQIKFQAGGKRSFSRTFEANVSWHWTWQDADTIGELADTDKQSIFALYSSFVRSLTNTAVQAEDLCDPTNTVPWVKDSVRIARTMHSFTNLVLKVRSYDDLKFAASPYKDLVFLKGNKLVALRSTDEELYYVGHGEGFHAKPGEVVWSISGEFMYFAKFNGAWKQVLMIQ